MPDGVVTFVGCQVVVEHGTLRTRCCPRITNILRANIKVCQFPNSDHSYNLLPLSPSLLEYKF